ncbi:MAG TPA: transporter substrate-binding domain-containing protein [Rickettsia endosymbiont of Columbicola hoogstraali]|nr:transporter substrate-binding domain-containing protein [Rickettsia endosymbiont of Columbicola hoogstraali]
MKIFKLFIFILIILKSFYSLSNSISKQEADLECENLPDKKTLTTAWYINEPYQYWMVTSNGTANVSGMDIELINALAAKIGINIEYHQDNWYQDQLDIQSGAADMTAGATYTDERNNYAYFSKPYRMEEFSLFIIEQLAKKLSFHNSDELMVQIRLFNLQIGIVKGTIYGEQKFTDFLFDDKNQDIIKIYQNNVELINGMVKKEINGFISDKIVGSVNILSKPTDRKIVEVPLNIKTPLHLMFSKKTVSLNVVEQFNFAIDEFLASNEYKKIVKTYIYNILLPKSIDSHWCHIIGLLGSIAFAFSGIILGIKNNSTLFGTFLLAILPSVSSCIMLDLIINHDTGHLNLYFTPSYFYYIFTVVLLGFIAVKLFSYYNKQITEDSYLENSLNNTIAVCDAFGQSAFIIIGVAMVIIQKIEPLNFWGPLFAFLTSNGGIIIRDFIIGENSVKRVPKGLSIKITLIWALVFSILLDMYGANPNYDTIKYSMIIIIVSAFITHLLLYHFGFREWRFRNNEVTTNEAESSAEK